MPFEDELGEALRQTGDGFTSEGRDLVDAGERRGRRMVARRRAAIAGGSALALALIGTAGAYANGMLWGSGGGGGRANVASSAEPPAPAVSAPGQSRSRVGTGAVSAEQLTGVLKQLLPQGTLSAVEARGTGHELGPMVSAVFDDGEGKSSVGFGLYRIDPKGVMAEDMLKCPSKTTTKYDSCTSETLADGSRLHLFAGYVFPDKRADVKSWRAIVVTPQGFMVDAHEENSAAEKGAPVSRPTPPLTLAQMQALVTSPLWHPALNDLPAAGQEEQPAATPRSGGKAAAMLEELLSTDGIPVVSRDDDGADLGYLVLDEGKGKSLVSLQIQPDNPKHPGTWADLFTGAERLPDGTKVLTRKQDGEKGGTGVVWWSAEALRPNGTRLILSAFNAETQSSDATRKEPVLSVERMKELVTSPKWASEYGL
ncbi:hypothetical protein M8Z33_14985 [Streptomyces sp. ZAF1911]|uniref:hypothetical protein n=1 Tax=unclassified Streptomyces TaxID=2593676 RepID=UPI00237B43D1|nr:hypothetical protein [Streptomyces sp. ZAF1911]MDD9377939.1 hypothetical protein [Streptomyces sp. ZAF1911]